MHVHTVFSPLSGQGTHLKCIMGLAWLGAQAVGVAHGVLGVFQGLSGVPAGCVADRTRRDRTLRVFGTVTLGAWRSLLSQRRSALRSDPPSCLCRLKAGAVVL